MFAADSMNGSEKVVMEGWCAQARVYRLFMALIGRNRTDLAG